MNENLTQMVKNMETGSSPVFPADNVDIPIEEVKAEEVQTPQSQEIGMVVMTTSLTEWFEANVSRFSEINQVKVAIRGVDPKKTLIMAVKDGSGEKDPDGNDRRVLKIFEDADIHPVLDAQGIDMKIYNNGFMIINNINGTIFTKCYGVRTGLIVVFCNMINGKLIPYEITKVKKSDKDVDIPQKNISQVVDRLNQPCNTEALQLLYKQIAKSIDTITTNQSAVDWFEEKQKEVSDINHHLQIDQVIIDVLS
jgi:hypothetical protein